MSGFLQSTHAMFLKMDLILIHRCFGCDTWVGSAYLFSVQI